MIKKKKEFKNISIHSVLSLALKEKETGQKLIKGTHKNRMVHRIEKKAVC